MLNTVQAICAAMNFYFAPPNVVIDCESSILSAIRSVLPSASVHCCRFHLGQAWWRHMNSIGLGLIHKDRSSDVAHWLQLFLDYHFFHRTKLQMLLLMTSCHAPASDTAIKFADYVYWRTISSSSSSSSFYSFKIKLLWIRIFRQSCGRSRRTCQCPIQTQ